jgi:condensin complex subunit 3
VNCYFDPATAENQTLRQILSYFLPVYCHSAASNTLSMARITVSSFHTLLAIRAAALDEDDSNSMVSPTSIAAQIMEWTDPRRTVASAGRAGVKEKVLDATPHAIIARDLLDRVTSNGCNKEERKLLVNGFLGKCYLPKEAGRDLLQEVYEKVTDVIEANLVAEAAGRNILNKVEVTVGKVLAEIREEEGEQTVMPSGAEDNEQEDGEEEEGEGEEEGEEGEEGEEEEGDEGDVTIVPMKQEEDEEMDMGAESEKIPTVSDHDESD